MDWRINSMIGFVLVCFAALLFVPSFAQPLAYHNFSDQLKSLGVANFSNVVTNFGFLVVGAWGLLTIKNNHSKKPSQLAWILFFGGVLFTAVGSGYYHWAPSNSTLLWDRLPITIAFMSLVSLITTEVINPSWGKKLLFPLLLVGFSSVLYWYYTEQQGAGDLRPYALVQFVPLIAIPFILLTYPVSKTLKKGIWLLIIFYILAKFSESFDQLIFDHFIISGHSLKHLLAAFGIYFMLAPAKDQ
jgi:hypothetical protein